MKEPSATLLGLVVCPLVPAFLGAIGTPWPNTDVQSIFGLMLAFYPISLLAALVLGAPTFGALRVFDLVRWWSALLCGAAVGYVVTIIVLDGSVPSMKDVYFTVPSGALAGLLFWILWRRGYAGTNGETQQ